MTASAWDKFLLLSWKNWIIQIRHPVQTIFEVLVPVLVCALLILIRGLVDVKVEDVKRYDSFPVNAILSLPDTNPILAYSPKNALLDIIVGNTAMNMRLGVVSFDTAEELQNFASLNEPFASIEFEDSLKVKFI